MTLNCTLEGDIRCAIARSITTANGSITEAELLEMICDQIISDPYFDHGPAQNAVNAISTSSLVAAPSRPVRVRPVLKNNIPVLDDIGQPVVKAYFTPAQLLLIQIRKSMTNLLSTHEVYFLGGRYLAGSSLCIF